MIKRKKNYIKLAAASVLILIIAVATYFVHIYHAWIVAEITTPPEYKLQEFILSGGGNTEHSPQAELYKEDFVRPEYLKDADILWLCVTTPDKLTMVIEDGDKVLMELKDRKEHDINGWKYKAVYEEISGWIPLTSKKIYIYPSEEIVQNDNEENIILKCTSTMDLRIAHAGQSDYQFTWEERENGQGKEIEVIYIAGRLALKKKK